MPELSGYLWMTITVASVAVLGVVLFAVMRKTQNRPCDPLVEDIRDEATRDLYHKDDKDQVDGRP